MAIKYLLIAAIVVFLFSGCSQTDNIQSSEQQFMTYVVDGSQGTMDTYTISEYQPIDLSESFEQDRADIESQRKYEAVRNQADREKKESERLKCYKKHDKNETEYYLEECEN